MKLVSVHAAAKKVGIDHNNFLSKLHRKHTSVGRQTSFVFS